MKLQGEFWCGSCLGFKGLQVVLFDLPSCNSQPSFLKSNAWNFHLCSTHNLRHTKCQNNGRCVLRKTFSTAVLSLIFRSRWGSAAVVHSVSWFSFKPWKKPFPKASKKDRKIALELRKLKLWFTWFNCI